MSTCPFCEIVSGGAPAHIVYRDDHVTAFHDSHPIAPTHILIIPNKHIVSLNELAPEDEPLVSHMVSVARQLAEQEGIHTHGYRLVFNTGRHAGQTISHLHLHLIGGRHLFSLKG